MKRLQIIALAYLSLWVSITGFAALPPQAIEQNKAFTSMLAKMMPAVVNVTVVGEVSADDNPFQAPTGNNDSSANPPNTDAPPSGDTPTSPFNLPDNSSNPNANSDNPKFQAVGSGVIVDADKGYIVTNAHVVSDARVVIITLNDGRRFKAKLIGADKPSDVAVLQISAKHLTALTLADSNQLQIGDFVAAIGNPFDLHQTVTSGVISALHRNIGIEGYENFIQTDAPINLGNSGGALINMQGQLVGINTAILAPTGGSVGIGFAIPSDMVRNVMNQLILYGKVKRGVLGVYVQDFTPALADAFDISGTHGALVTSVIPGSPAAKAGLQVQDVIEKVDNVSISTASELRNTVSLLPIGSKITILTSRGNKTLTLTAVIISPKDLLNTLDPALTTFLDGVRLTDYNELVPELGAIRGVGVVDVDVTSDAWMGGLMPGDII